MLAGKLAGRGDEREGQMSYINTAVHSERDGGRNIWCGLWTAHVFMRKLSLSALTRAGLHPDAET